MANLTLCVTVLLAFFVVFTKGHDREHGRKYEYIDEEYERPNDIIEPSGPSTEVIENALGTALDTYLGFATHLGHGFQKLIVYVQDILRDSPPATRKAIQAILGTLLITAGLWKGPSRIVPIISIGALLLPFLLVAKRPEPAPEPVIIVEELPKEPEKPYAPPPQRENEPHEPSHPKPKPKPRPRPKTTSPPKPKPKPSSTPPPPVSPLSRDEAPAPPPQPEEQENWDFLDDDSGDNKPGLKKELVEDFTDRVLPQLIPDNITGKKREEIGKKLAKLAPSVVSISHSLQWLPKAIQEAIMMPLQLLPGGDRYTSVNHGNTEGFVLNLSRSKRASDNKKMKDLLRDVEDQATQKNSDTDQLSSTVVSIMRTIWRNVGKPWAQVYIFFFNIWMKIVSIPFAIFFSLPALSVEAAKWYIQPFPIRVVQALYPLFSRGDLCMKTIFRKFVYPLPVRLFFALFPHFTGMYKFPRKFVGLLPEYALPHFRIRVPDGDYKRLDNVIPYELGLEKFMELPLWLYNNLVNRLPKKLRALQKDLNIPAIVVKPWQILGLFPRFFTEGPNNSSIKTALLLLRIGAPLVYITFFLNPFNVPGAILLGIIFTIPSIFTFALPTRWFNPIIVLKLLLGLRPVLPLF